MKPPIPTNELPRLAALEDLGILDTPPEEAFDDITRLAATLCNTPVALVSLVDGARQWFKSKVGTHLKETPRDMAFCAHAICGSETFIVEDAVADDRFADNPLVTGPESLRFYAGVPLVNEEGLAMGALCVMDRVPRKLDPMHQQVLKVLGEQVMARLDLQRQIREREKAEARLVRLNQLHAMLSRVNAATIQIRDRSQLFETTCRLAVEWGLAAAWVAQIQPGVPITLSAHSGSSGKCLNPDGTVPEGFADALRLTLQEDHPLVCNDLLSDETQSALRPILDCCGYRSAAAFPLSIAGTGYGVIVFYSEQPDQFLSDEVILLGELARDLSFAVDSIDQEMRRRRAENALRESEERFRLAFEQAPVGIFMVGLNQRFIRVNQRFCDFVGYSANELLEHVELRHLTHAEDLDEGLEMNIHLQSNAGGITIERRFIRKDGRIFWARLTQSLVPSIRKEPERFIGFISDITLRKQAEQERDSLFNLTADLCCVADFDGRLEQVNPAWTQCLGWSRKDLIGKKWMDFVHPEDRQKTAAVDRDLQMGKPVVELENRYLCKDGSYRWLAWNSQSIVENRQLFGIARDITDRRYQAIALAHSNRALQLLSRCNEALIRSESEAELIESVCMSAVEIGGFAMAWVGYLKNDAVKSIRPKAHAARERCDLPAIPLSWSDEMAEGDSAPGRVLNTGKAVFIHDFEETSFSRPWKDFENAQGYKGVACIPLLAQNETFGVLVLYLSESRELAGDEIRLLYDLADDMAFGIHNHRAGLERRKIHDAVLSLARGVSVSSGAEFFNQLVRGSIEALGANSGVIARFNPKGTKATTISAIMGGKRVPNFHFSIKGTPCEHIHNAGLWVVSDNLQLRYSEAGKILTRHAEAFAGTALVDSTGNSIGVMFLTFDTPLVHQEFISSTLKIFAPRAAGELERQKSDAMMREQAALLDKAQDAILVHDFHHRVRYWNRSAERMYGWAPREHSRGKAPQMIYSDPASLVIATETTLARGEWVGEIDQLDKDGQALTVEARWTLVRDETGKPESILSINTDITEQKKLEQQFLRAQRMESIGTLAGGIAHDINNVLAPIMMSIDMLRCYVQDEEGNNILDVVGASARRGAEMVKQVLSFARGVEGKPEEIQLKHVFSDLLRIMDETFPKNIRLETRIQDDLWHIRADHTQIHQVMLNLCVNARDAMPEGGTIMVTAQNIMIEETIASANIEAHVGPYVTIEVEDTGPGIPPEIMDRIFDPFFTTKELGKGTGLGLSTSLAIIKSHGGFLRVFSDPGDGTRFRIYLPALTEPGWAAVDSPQSELPKGKGETVLVVDDEVYIRQVTSRTLEAYGYKVLLASNGSEAVSLYVEHQDEIQIVLTDMMMPVMDGPATVRMLRRLNPFIPIICASGLNAKEKVEKASAAGANDFLAKPYTAETLLKSIRAVLRNRS
ncbi:MAG: PAS domain S-box protein [Akkermansiaceae bacterium]|nr:PAS domain S-box protein [Akkermansiaceae bacterium]